MLVRLVLRNALRHKLRSLLTAVGIVVAITAFGLLRTVVDAWYAGANATSAARLVTRNAISLVFPLPIAYWNRIRQVEGVSSVSYANWFGGVYIDEKNFFPQFAIEPASYLELYSEFLLQPDQKRAFLRNRQGAITGRKLAERFDWEIGDTIPIRGTIFPGNWTFVLEGIYQGARENTEETQLFFHWDYLNEQLRKVGSQRADHVGVFYVGLDRVEDAPVVSARIDTLFDNSVAETLTETERAFQLGFVAMTEAILWVIQAVSFVVILIIMAVMANTMAMTARERSREYATLKALGFSGRFVVALVFGESLLISVIGGLLGLALIFPAADYFREEVGSLFPVFNVADRTLWMGAGAALLVGVVAAVLPAWRAVRLSVTEALRTVG